MSGRQVQPELLDELPPGQREAQGSRRDLRLINRLMGHVGALQKVWRETGAERWCTRIVDLGGGDGTFLLRFVQSLPVKPRTGFLIDRQPVVSSTTAETFEGIGCSLKVVGADVFEWLESSPVVPGTFLFANLFLHHFQHEALRRLLELASHQCQVFAACDPRRAPVSLGASHLLGVIGCNAVTRHDAVVSVRAGFRNNELTPLWPQEAGWVMHETKLGLFSHLFRAAKRE